MRKFLITSLAAITALLSFTSCDDSNKEGTYTFLRISQYSVSSAKDRQEIEQYIQLTDPYLVSGNQNTRTGKYKDVCNDEIDVFISHCQALDKKYITDRLGGIDDFYSIALHVYNPLARLVTVTWYQNGNLNTTTQ